VCLLLLVDLPSEERQEPTGRQRPVLGEKEEVDQAVEEGIGDGDVERPVDITLFNSARSYKFLRYSRPTQGRLTSRALELN